MDIQFASDIKTIDDIKDYIVNGFVENPSQQLRPNEMKPCQTLQAQKQRDMATTGRMHKINDLKMYFADLKAYSNMKQSLIEDERHEKTECR